MSDDLPYRARLESCTLCQLDCRDCYMRLSENGYCGVGAGYLKFNDFKKFIEDNPFVEEIELSNDGEIFLNPDLLKILEYAHAKGVRLTARAGVNFNLVSEEVLEALVRCEVLEMTVSIDGSSQKAYSWYRRGGDFEKVIANVKKLNGYKNKYGLHHPVLRWKYIILPSTCTVKEIERAKKMAAELGMEMQFDKDYHSFVPDNVAEVEKATGLIYQQSPDATHYDRHYYYPCFALWIEPQIGWDGRFLGCCNNHGKNFGGNVFEMGLENYLKSDVVTRAKKMLMGGEVAEDLPCGNFGDGNVCWYYKVMAQENDFIKQEEIDRVIMYTKGLSRR